jgi:hypothetical protein
MPLPGCTRARLTLLSALGLLASFPFVGQRRGGGIAARRWVTFDADLVSPETGVEAAGAAEGRRLMA